MSLNFPYENGVVSVLRGHWQLTLKTPLFIRQGIKASFKQQSNHLKKGRGEGVAISWKQKPAGRSETEWSELSDFNYHFAVGEQSQLEVQYSIPASSIRGALRQWAIKQLVEREDWRFFTLEEIKSKSSEQLAEQMQKARTYLEDSKNRWRDVHSLFGIVYDLQANHNDPLTWAGRLRLTTKIAGEAASKFIDASGKKIKCEGGPQNIAGHVSVRNPLDRVTVAAKEGGLHFGLEMSEEQCFHVDFHILNFRSTDSELLDLWCQDIDAGFLRFGGLTSQGRGRVQLSSERYQFFASPVSPLFDEVKKLGALDLSKDLLFGGIWIGAELTRSQLSTLGLPMPAQS